MEPVWPRPALESQGLRRRKGRAFALAVALAVSAPGAARAHGMEFLLARLDLSPGQVRIELTADCEGNLMLPDAATARAAMQRLFHVRPRGAPEAGWQAFAPLRFEERERLDPESPLPPDPTWDGRPHQLLTAVWEWRPPEGTAFQLALPRGEPHDALLWRRSPDSTQPVQWKMLIAGDATDWLEVPSASLLGRIRLPEMLAASGLIGLGIWWRWRKRPLNRLCL